MSEQEEDELLDEIIEAVQLYVMYLLDDPEPDVDEELEQLAPIIMYFYDAKEKYALKQSVLEKFIKKIEESNEEIDEDKLLDEYKSEIDNGLSRLKLGEDNEDYKEFKLFISNARSKPHDDSEIKTISESTCTVDPITKLPLSDPVKNIKCGHVYEKSSIMQLLTSKKNVKCPIAGCIAAPFVKKQYLVPDIALKRHLDSEEDYESLLASFLD